MTDLRGVIGASEHDVGQISHFNGLDGPSGVWDETERFRISVLEEHRLKSQASPEILHNCFVTKSPTYRSSREQSTSSLKLSERDIKAQGLIPASQGH